MSNVQLERIRLPESNHNDPASLTITLGNNEPDDVESQSVTISEHSSMVTESVQSKQVEEAVPQFKLFQFGEGESGWYTVDDDVMGGVSSSRVRIFEASADSGANTNFMFFNGTMSLDNNGGFASVRSEWQPTDLSGTDGVLLRVLGDGKAYRLRIRTASAGPRISYNALFQTDPEEWKLVYVPYASMIPTYRGFRMDVESLNPATIAAFGFMLSDKQAGEFALAVDWMQAVTEAEARVILDQRQG